MIILAGIGETGAIAALTGDGMGNADILRRILLARLDGCWSSKRRVIIYDEPSGKFVLVIKDTE